MYVSKIGQLIKESPYKRKYIEDRMEISRNTLSSWCLGKTHPSAPQLFFLAELIGREVKEFYIKGEGMDEV